MGWMLTSKRVVGRLFGRSKRTEPQGEAASEVLIVRRDMSPQYYFFFEIFAKQNRLNVVVDRRVDERRSRPGHVFAERRSSDRRGPPPPTWDEGDIVIPHDRQVEAPMKPPLALGSPRQR